METPAVRAKTRDAFDKRTPIFDKLHQHKAGTPVGGGLHHCRDNDPLPLFLLMMKYFGSLSHLFFR